LSGGLVVAWSITLLIVDLQVPDVPNLQSGTQLRESVPRMRRLEPPDPEPTTAERDDRSG
jgi:hypothetical protein